MFILTVRINILLSQNRLFWGEERTQIPSRGWRSLCKSFLMVMGTGPAEKGHREGAEHLGAEGEEWKARLPAKSNRERKAGTGRERVVL